MQTGVGISEGGAPTGTTGGVVPTVQRVVTVNAVRPVHVNVIPTQIIAGGVDLMQVYPTKTNNLNYSTYEDYPDEDLFCACLSIRVSQTMEVIRVMLCLIIFFLFLSFIVILVEIASSWWYIYFGAFYFLMMIALCIMKCYLLYQVYCFIKYSRTSSLDYHQYGMKLYYGLHADLPISFLLSMIWLVVIGGTCLSGSSWSCNRYTSFDHVILGTITWLLSFPLFLYTIFGFVMVSKLPRFFEKHAYRNYETSQDKKYCLFYHYNKAYPPKQACVCCGNCCQPGSCNCCVGCDTLPKCGIKAISIWTIICSLGALYMILMGISWMFWSIYAGFLFFFYGVVLFYLHLAAAIYGLKLTCYQNPIDFHKYTHLAMTHYNGLGGIYLTLFIFWGGYQLLVALIIALWWGHGGYFVWSLIMVSLEGFISYLPWEAVRLIDSNAKWETCTYKHLPNAINMDLVVNGANNSNGGNGNFISNVSDGNGASGVTGGVVAGGGAVVAMAPVNREVKSSSNLLSDPEPVKSEETIGGTTNELINV